MTGPYGDLTPARRLTGVQVSADIALLCTLESVAEDGTREGDVEEGVPWRQPLGLRACPGPNEAEGVSTLDGSFRELVQAWCPRMQLPSGQPSGSTWLHSVGAAPRVLALADDTIKAPHDATEAAMLGTKFMTQLTALNTAIMNAYTALNLTPAATNLADTIVLVNTIRAMLIALGASLPPGPYKTFADNAPYTSTIVFFK